MAYAKVDENGRIMEWSEDKLSGLDVEFSNGSLIDEACTAGVDDFVIKDGKAIWSPLPKKLAVREAAVRHEELDRRGLDRTGLAEVRAEEAQEAIAELGAVAAGNAASIEDIMDAIAELGALVAEKRGGGIMTKIYYNQVKVGKMIIDNVPKLWREKVRDLLNADTE